MFAAISPASARAKMSIGIVRAEAKSAYPATEPTRLSTRIGLRPKRSDRRPHTGEKRNWRREYEARSAPSWAGLAPSVSPYFGSSGMTIPNPSRSVKTMRKRMPSEDRRGEPAGRLISGCGLALARSGEDDHVVVGGLALARGASPALAGTATLPVAARLVLVLLPGLVRTPA